MMQSNSHRLRKFLPVVGVAVACGLSAGAGCPLTGPGTIGGGVVNTGISIQKDGFIAVGDGYIAYGDTPGGSTGVSYFNVSTSQVKKIVGDSNGDFLGDAIYAAGKKIVLVKKTATANEVNVHDTMTGITFPLIGTDVFDISPGAILENSYIAVDGSIVAILNRSIGGTTLVAADVSGLLPNVKIFTNPLVSPINVGVDGATGRIAVVEENTTIALFNFDGTFDQVPDRIDVKAGGPSIAFAPSVQVGSGFCMFQELNTADVYLLKISDGTLTKLVKNPGATGGTNNFDVSAGFFAYFLGGAGNSDSQEGDRVAIGALADLTTITPGSGDSLGGGALAGFGRSLAISPDGFATYTAGRFGQSIGGGVNEPSILQANFGTGFELLTDSKNDPVPAADVAATSVLVGFKIADGIGAKLGYYKP